MPLTLIATPGAPDANAYLTVAQADALASYRVGAAAWLTLSADQKIQAIVTATSSIDTLEPSMCGARTTTTQALAFPRDGATTLPDTLVRATFELALSYAPAIVAGGGTDVLNPDPQSGNIKRKKVDVLETEYFAPTTAATSEAGSLARYPASVQMYLAPLMCGGDTDANAWGIGLVERAS